MAADRLHGRVVAVSPHLDDVVLSLGAALRHARRLGSTVVVVTVFAGDVDSDKPAGRWDRAAGFATAGAAARTRRAEDRRACSILGFEPRWLSFFDDQYADSAGDDAIGQAVTGELVGADVVLLPGFPLSHPDHRRVTDLLLKQRGSFPRYGLYVEQPYALSTRLSSPPAWERLRADLGDRLSKLRACGAYPSQLPLLGRPMLRLLRHEIGNGGELVSWVDA